MSQRPIKVHCIDQEYWVIRRDRCECGGTYDTARGVQMVGRRSWGTADVIVASCVSCEKERSYEFDITSFYGAMTEAMLGSAGLSVAEKDELVQEALVARAGGGMESVLGHISDLARSGDRLALEYIEDAVRDQKSRLQDGAG